MTIDRHNKSENKKFILPMIAAIIFPVLAGYYFIQDSSKESEIIRKQKEIKIVKKNLLKMKKYVELNSKEAEDVKKYNVNKKKLKKKLQKRFTNDLVAATKKELGYYHYTPFVKSITLDKQCIDKLKVSMVLKPKLREIMQNKEGNNLVASMFNDYLQIVDSKKKFLISHSGEYVKTGKLSGHFIFNIVK